MSCALKHIPTRTAINMNLTVRAPITILMLKYRTGQTAIDVIYCLIIVKRLYVHIYIYRKKNILRWRPLLFPTQIFDLLTII